MADDNSDQYDLEMVENPAYSSDEDEFNMSTTDSEYGEEILHEQTITPKTVTAKSSAANNDFYMKSMRRQNICFGSSVFLLAGMFIAAYFYSDISFTPANAGIFGDETAMKGVSGEVGLDADNAETQEIIDEEIIELEETGHWGEKAKEKRSKIDDIIFDKNKIGEHNWVEDSDWWKKNLGNMDVSVQCLLCTSNLQHPDFYIVDLTCILCTTFLLADLEHDKGGTQTIQKDEEEGTASKKTEAEGGRKESKSSEERNSAQSGKEGRSCGGNGRYQRETCESSS